MTEDLFSCLAELCAEDRERLLRIGRAEAFSPQALLVRQGAPVDGMLVIRSGRVAVQVAREGAAGPPIDVSLLGPGDLLGEMSYCTGEPPSASAVGVEAGTVVRLPRAALAALAEEDPAFGGRLYRSLASLLARRLRDTTARLPPLIVEEVAQVRRHHATLTGRLQEGAVPPPLQDAIERFKQGLLDLDRQLARDQGQKARGRPSALTQGDAAAQVALLCDQLTDVLSAEVARARDPREADGIGAYVLRETFGYFMRSRFADRAFSKPRGYAGDYYTLELVYDNQPAGDGRLGPLIDAWFLRRPSARAVRARRGFLRDALLERYRRVGTGQDSAYRVMSLGSGSARELLDLMTALRGPDIDGDEDGAAVRATCLDIDMEALAFSNQLASGLELQGRFQFTKENVLLLGQGMGRTRPAPQDVIYSAGLFDYLQPAHAVQALNWICAQLEPRGLAIIGNFDSRCPDRALLDHILDWRLLYRTEAEMRELFARSAFAGGRIEVRWEASGVNLFVLAERPA